jgi:hypothetical protein
MKKRINSTGREKIDSELIDIRVNKADGQKHPTFTASFDFTSFSKLDQNARVYVEPYFISSSMRFDFGTLACPTVPVDTTLSELDENESPLFRVKVVDESGIVGRILADANGIRPRNEEDDGANRKSLLPLITKDLGELIWCLGYDANSGPVLQISSKIAGLSAKLKTNPLLQGAIYPEAFRQVLRELINDDEFGEQGSWRENWRKFILALTGEDLGEKEFEGDADDEREVFINTAVKAFAESHGFATNAAKFEEVVA